MHFMTNAHCITIRINQHVSSPNNGSTFQVTEVREKTLGKTGFFVRFSAIACLKEMPIYLYQQQGEIGYWRMHSSDVQIIIMHLAKIAVFILVVITY